VKYGLQIYTFSKLLTNENPYRKEELGKRFSPFTFQYPFTPLESSSIYAGDGGNRKDQLLIEGSFKAPPLLTGFTNNF